jgi:hydroxyacylglutathione hydrolase
MFTRTIPVGPLQCNCTIVADAVKKEAIVIDPGDQPEQILGLLRAAGLALRAIVNTHTHIDHVGGNARIRADTGARLLLHAADVPLYDMLEEQAAWLGGIMAVPVRAEVDAYVDHDDSIEFGSLRADIIHTPGHTPGSICVHVPGDAPLLLSGDTLFAGSIGRTDLWGGDHEQELDSIHSRLLTLADATLVVPGHGPATTIGREKRQNPFLRNP